MQNLLRRVIQKRTRMIKQNFRPGDTVEVYVKVVEGEKERVQIYAGTVIKIQGTGTSKTFTVRKMSNGVGVERCFPFTSPSIEKVDVLTHGKVRRGKLYYLRDLRGRKARIQFDIVADDTNAVDTPPTGVAAEKSTEKAETPKA